jgi:CIC family chloride channel protein
MASLPAETRRTSALRAMERRLRRVLRLWRLYLLRFELRLAPSEAQRLFLLTMTIGAACGLAAVAFHLCIEAAEVRLIGRAATASGTAFIVWMLLTPTLGGLVCGSLLTWAFPRARGSGIPQVKQAFATTPPVVPLRDAIGKFLIGSLQIGSGASLGREGPTVQICAGIASFLGRLAQVSPKNQRRLLPVGVAAGIAAAFNAPIAAVTFTIEEVVGALDQAVLSGVIVAAALAAVIERGLLGENPVFTVPQSYTLKHASSLLLYAGIGLAAGLASVVFTESLLALRGRFARLKVIPVWARPAAGGAITGALAIVAALGLGSAGITGGGYSVLGQILNGELAWRVLLALGAMKLVATVASYASGGAGGIFAPTLFIGGALGGAFGVLDASWFGHLDEPVGGFALVGMGAMFAGVIRAPITSVLIIIEMTRGYALILPLMLANMTAYALARRFRSETIYEALLAQDGVETRRPAAGAEPHRVGSIIGSVRATVLDPAMPAEEVLVRCGPDPKHIFPVVDAARMLCGIVTQDELSILRSAPDLLPVTTAYDLMRPPVFVRGDDDLGRVVDQMLTSGLRELPVIDRDGRFVGIIDDQSVARAYQQKPGG